MAFRSARNAADRPVPSTGIGRSIPRGPVARRELGRDVARVDAEPEDVPLGDPQVLQQPPGRVRQAGRLRAPEFGGQIGDRLVEVQVRMPPAEQVEQVRAKLVRVAHVSPPLALVGSSPTRARSLPKFSPRNRPRKARGAFSRPSTMSSLYLIFPSLSHPETSRRKSASRSG